MIFNEVTIKKPALDKIYLKPTHNLFLTTHFDLRIKRKRQKKKATI